MNRFAMPLCAAALALSLVTSVQAQTYTEAEQAAMAQIEAEQPGVYAMMVATGRFDDTIQTHGHWIATLEETFFGGYDPALWEVQYTEALTTDRLFLDFAAEVAEIPLTEEALAFGDVFYSSDLGQRLQIIESEIGQLRIRDGDQYDAALAAFREIESTDDPRAVLILRMEDVFPKVEFLLDRTEAQEFAFLSGLRAEGYYLDEMSDDDLRNAMDFDREAIRTGIEDYYNVYRMMMFDDLTLADMTQYVDAFDSPAGRIFYQFTGDGSDALVWAQRFEAGRVMAPIWLAEIASEQAAQ